MAAEAVFSITSLSVAYRRTVEEEDTLICFWTMWSDAPLLIAAMTAPLHMEWRPKAAGSAAQRGTSGRFVQ